MTIRYYTTDLSKAMEYMRIHLRDKYFVSAYKRGIEYVVQVSGLEEVKDEPQTETSTNSEKVQLTDEPQTEQGKCPFDDEIPCEWVCPNSKTDCAWK